MRYFKKIYVEAEDEKRAVDKLLEALDALTDAILYDHGWHKEELDVNEPCWVCGRPESVHVHSDYDPRDGCCTRRDLAAPQEG